VTGGRGLEGERARQAGPDLRAAPIGVRPDGTIDRGARAAITNPADLDAIEAALTLSDEVWALSMGPPNAEAALREAVALGVTRASLLCDRLWRLGHLGNVHALAAAICQLGGADPVLCGISALDGETGALAHDMRELPIRSEDPLEARNRIR
jgi:electron transfer flavoprotein alpha/beta subunit